MMDKLNLAQIGLYNPQRMSDDVVLKVFIVRQNIFENLLGKIKSESKNSIPQHHLITAQRGMGKSTLLKRIEVELRSKALAKNYVPLLFPEEQYNVSSLAELWLNCLDALADTLEIESNAKLVKEIDAHVEEISKEPDDEERASQAYASLQLVSSQLKRRMVLLIDNINIVLGRLEIGEQHQLRKMLTQNKAPIVVGASSVSMDEINDYTAPFYDAFESHYLKKLTFKELLKIITSLTELTQAVELQPEIYSEIGRLKTLHQLTGGNPRTAVMLFRLIVNGFSTAVNEDLEALLDEVTPLYKARFEELAEQSQIIIDAIALNWEPITIAQLRNETRLENNQLSPQLKRLLETGWLDKQKAYKSKGAAYQISERFFNIWFLMRRSSRRQKKMITCLSKFLEMWYGDRIDEIAEKRLNQKYLNANQVVYDIAISDVLQNEELAEKLRSQSYLAARDQFKNEKSLNWILETHDENGGDLELQVQEIMHLFKEQKDDQAVKLLNKSLKINPKSHLLLGIQGLFFKTIFKEYKKAEKSFMLSIEEDPTYGYALVQLGNLNKDHFSEYEKSEKYYLKALDIYPEYIYVNYELGNLYKDKLYDYKKAEKYYLKTIEIDVKFDRAYATLGHLYHYDLKEYKKAEKSYLSALEINPSIEDVHAGLGQLYQKHLKQYGKAEKSYLKALETDYNRAYVFVELGYLYQHNLYEFEKAEKAYLEALNIDVNFAYVYAELGNLYQHFLNNSEKSEKSYLKAIEINSEYAYAHAGLGSLYQHFFNEYKKSETYYLNAMEINPNYSYAYSGLAVLYQYHIKAYKKSEESYLKAIEIDPNNGHVYTALGNLYQDQLRDYKKAEMSYQKALQIDSQNVVCSYNLVFLYRDRLNMLDKAKNIFRDLSIVDGFKDSYKINKALFAIHENNLGIASTELKEALNIIKDGMKPDTQDDWFRASAVIHKMGHTLWFVKILDDLGFDKILAPFRIANQALIEDESMDYIQSKAVELRESAIQILERIELLL